MLKRLLPILLLLLSGCASLTEDPLDKMSASELYNEAKEKLDAGEYQSALDLYSKLEGKFPYGRYTQQAQLETIYAHYKGDEPEAAVAAADRFIKLHPRHPNVDYAYYMRGRTTAQPRNTFLSRWFPRDPAERSPEAAKEAFRYFNQLTSRYPSSKYTPDALKRMVVLRNDLARYEVKVADYYLGRKAYQAAVNRSKEVLESYPGAEAIPEALTIMVRSYRAMELTTLADDALRVFRLNYPEHPNIVRLESGEPWEDSE